MKSKRVFCTVMVLFAAIIVSIVVRPLRWRAVVRCVRVHGNALVRNIVEGQNCEYVGDPWDMYNLLRLSARYLAGCTSIYGRFPASQHEYDLLVDSIVCGVVWKRNKYSVRKRFYYYDNQNTGYCVRVSLDSEYPVVYFDHINPRPRFHFPDVACEMDAMSNLINRLTACSQRSITRYWDVRESIVLLRYFSSQPEITNFLSQWFTDEKEDPLVRQLCSDVLDSVTNEFVAD